MLCSPIHAQIAQSKQIENIKRLEDINYKSLHDLSLADSLLLHLEDQLKPNITPNLRVKLGLVKIRLYASVGDYVLVSFEINRLKKLKYFNEFETQDKLLLEVYTLLYGGQIADSKLELKLNEILKDSSTYSPFARLLVCSRLGNMYSEEGSLGQFQQIEENAKRIVQEINKPEAEFFYRSAFGQFYYFLDNTKQAHRYFIASKTLAINQNWKCSEQYANLNIGEAYLYAGNMIKAKKYFDTVLQNKRVTELRDLYQVYGCLEYYYKLNNKPDSSYYYLDLRNEVDDRLEEMKSKAMVHQLNNMYSEELDFYKYQLEIKKNQRLKALFSIFILVLIVLGVFGFFVFSHIKRTNITLKRQKSQIETNLLLKEKVIKEIHHRIKNNLQIVSSILNLQVKQIKDKEAIEIIEESKERIQAIALIHNQLHLAKETAFVEMDTYLLQFVEQMKQSFLGVDKKVVFDLEIQKIKMSIDQAVPLGMILCELLSNSYKHGFKDRNEGRIKIQMRKSKIEKTKVIHIDYEDDGSGYHGKTPFLKQESTGAEIIQAFVEQLEADFLLDTNFSGFKIQLRFEASKLKN